MQWWPQTCRGNPFSESSQPFSTTSSSRVSKKSIIDLKDNIVNCSIDTFEAAGTDLLPTPSKSHDTFNLRDIWKVSQGICSLKSKKVSDPLVTRCFCHENVRVYGDRLTTDEDRAWLRGKLGGQLSATFGIDPTVFDSLSTWSSQIFDKVPLEIVLSGG